LRLATVVSTCLAGAAAGVFTLGAAGYLMWLDVARLLPARDDAAGARSLLATFIAGDGVPRSLEVGDIELLFTDVVMPGGMNGRELADAMRERYPHIRVLYTSGCTENAILHYGRLEPGVRLLSKPYRRAELAATVRQALTTT